MSDWYCGVPKSIASGAKNVCVPYDPRVGEHSDHTSAQFKADAPKCASTSSTLFDSEAVYHSPGLAGNDSGVSNWLARCSETGYECESEDGEIVQYEHENPYQWYSDGPGEGPQHRDYALQGCYLRKCSGCRAPAVRGCTDPAATNYNSAASEDDGSCTLAGLAPAAPAPAPAAPAPAEPVAVAGTSAALAGAAALAHMAGVIDVVKIMALS